MDVNWLLGFFAVASLLGFFVLGWRRYRAPWVWADPVYYPLATVGIVLLFFSNEKVRTLADLRFEQGRVEQSLREHARLKPEGSGQDSRSDVVPVSFQFFTIYQELSSLCEQAPNAEARVEARCQVAIKDGRLISAAFKGFNPASPKSPEFVEDYCNRGYALIDSLAAGSGIGSEIYYQLKKSFSAVTAEGLHPQAWETTDERRKAFLAQISSEHDRLVSTMPALPEDVEKYYRDNWKEEASFAGQVYSALALCLRIEKGGQERLKTIRRWTEEEAQREAVRADIEAKMREVQQVQPQSQRDRFVTVAYLKLWPFVLSFALALKFAKGVAALRKHHKWWVVEEAASQPS